MNLILIGMRGVGKSYVCRLLTVLTKRPVISTDMMVEYEAGQTIPEIIAADHGEANTAILALGDTIKVEERVEAQNRLAKCLWEQGDLAGSKKEYQATLALDPLNRIAERNLERLKGLIKQVGKKTTASTEGATTPAGIFIQEAGSTGFAALTNVADAGTLAQVNPGDSVELIVLGNRLIVPLIF